MLDQVRPQLLSSAVVHQRADGSQGIYDPPSGHTFETTAEQANLVALFDGERTLLEISAEYMNRHGYVPFAAIDELLWGLLEAGLLTRPPENLERLNALDRATWVELLRPIVHLRVKLWWPTALRVLELLAWPVAGAAVALTVPRAALRPVDVLLFYVGLVTALVLRGRMKAAACAAQGAPPGYTQLVSFFRVVWFLEPDAGPLVMLELRQRVLAHVAALVGAASAVGLTWWSPGLAAGAAVVLLFDLSPLLPSSMDSILAAISRQGLLRDQLRNVVGLPLLKALITLNVKRWGGFMLGAAVYGGLWLAALLFAIFGLGTPAAFQLVELWVSTKDGTGPLAGLGALALFSAIPVALVGLAFEFVESLFEVAWPRARGGRQAGGAAELAAFRSIPLFSKLPEVDLAKIAALSREVTYGAGERIVEEGTPGNTFCLIRRGIVSVVRGEGSQHARVVARLGAGDCFGETAMLKDGVRTATVQATTETVVVELASESFEHVVATIGGVDFASVLRAASAIGKSKLFRGLPPERLSSLASKFVPRALPAGTDVVKFGDPGHEFFLIARGAVEVLSGEGKLLVKLGDGDVFGEIALLRNIPRTATVRTTSDTLVLVLGREVFLQALQADLALSSRVEEIARARAPGDADGAVPPAGQPG